MKKDIVEVNSSSDHDIKVSIHCLTYNHEKYISDAIESFVAQVTNFSYEILIQDDASTDKTPDIIRHYQSLYPEMIKPIYQTTNQYSLGKSVSRNNYLRAKGKYIAICEGDDYWIDPKKLQKQYNYMEQNKNCTLCVHNAYIINGQNKKKRIGKIKPCKKSGIISTGDVIKGGGGFCATNSIFAPTRLFLQQPSYFEILSIDLVLQMYLASCGETYCFSDYMSVYRKAVKGSWTDRMKDDLSKRRELTDKAEAARIQFDEETNYKYHDAVEYRNKLNRFNAYVREGDFNSIKNSEFSSVWKNLPKKRKFMLHLYRMYPALAGKINEARVINKRKKQES